MTGLRGTKYMRIFPIQEINQTRRLPRDRALGLTPTVLGDRLARALCVGRAGAVMHPKQPL